MIPYGHQEIDEDDVKAVVAALRSDWLTQGPAVERFERDLAQYCGARYAVAVSNGTAALHIACIAAGLGTDDNLWTSPNTFAASANCALYCGARPGFVDIDPRTYNMSPEKLREKLAAAASSGTLPKILVPVHFAGQPCDMEEIHGLANSYGCLVLEDACHAIGSTHKESRVGSCRYSDMTVFSFHPVKTITSGEGGAVLTNDRDLHERLLVSRNHGIVKDATKFEEPSAGQKRPWYHEMQFLGYNYRMTDLQAALGASQLKKLDAFRERRRAIVARYNDIFGEYDFLTTPHEDHSNISCFHLYVLQIDFAKIGKERGAVMERLNHAGIGTQVHYIPVHTHPYYRREYGYAWGDYPASEEYYSKALSLPLYPGMTDADLEYVADTLLKIVSR